MADYKIPNLCGTSVKFNAIQSKLDTMIANAVDGLEVDASALKSTLDTDVTSLVSDLKALVPELPALPDVNLQGQLTSLAGLAAGSGAHNTLLASVTSKFGSGLSAGGFSLDSLVSDAASAISGGTDLCGAVPNFSVPAAGGAAVQKAIEVKQAEEDSLPEKLSTLLANINFTAAKTAVEKTQASYGQVGEDVPAADIGPYRVSKDTTEISISGNKKNVSNVSKVKVVTSKSASKTEERNNVAPEDSGFTRKKVWKRELFKDGDIGNQGSKVETVVIKEVPTYVDVSAYHQEGNAWLMLMDLTSMAKDERFTRESAIRGLKITQMDYFEVDGKTISIHNEVHSYVSWYPRTAGNPHRLALPMWDGAVYAVTYSYYDNYDADFALLPDE